MSEEIKAKAVEDENPSIAEKETKVLKKMGLDTWTETVTKVDLRKPKEETDAIQEQSTDEVPVRDESSASEEIQKENEAQPEEPTEQSQEKEKEKEVVDTIKAEEKVKEPLEPKVEIPEGVNDLINFMAETGGTLEDYVKLNKDYSNLENEALVKEYYNTTKPHLNSEEIDFLIKDNFSYDQEIEDATNIKRKDLAYKEEVAKAKNYLEDQKNKYYKEVKMSDNLNSDQQKAVDFFNRYNNEQQENAQIQEKVRNGFKLKTDEVFNQEFKGFDFNIDNKKFQFKVKDVDKTKNTQMDIMNVVGS